MIDKTFSIERGASPTEMAVHDFINKATQDYIAMRLMLPFGRVVYDNAAHAGGKCIEKMMKAFLLLGQFKTFKEILDYSHDLRKPLKSCVEIDVFFNDETLQDFADNYGDVGHTLLGYGMSGKNISSYGVNLGNIVNMVDRLYLGTFMRSDYGAFFMYGTSVALLFSSYPMAKISNSLMSHSDADNLRKILCKDNNYIDTFNSQIQNFHERILPNKEDQEVLSISQTTQKGL